MFREPRQRGVFLVLPSAVGRGGEETEDRGNITQRLLVGEGSNYPVVDWNQTFDQHSEPVVEWNPLHSTALSQHVTGIKYSCTVVTQDSYQDSEPTADWPNKYNHSSIETGCGMFRKEAEETEVLTPGSSVGV